MSPRLGLGPPEMTVFTNISLLHGFHWGPKTTRKTAASPNRKIVKNVKLDTMAPSSLSNQPKEV
jgi:hypothetical protein